MTTIDAAAALVRLSALVEQRIGVFAPVTAGDSLERVAAERARALGLGSIARYVDHLGLPTSQSELQALIDVLTNGKTYFMRTPAHFRALRNLLADRRLAGLPPARIWSAACATGEEAYSIAIVATEISAEIELWASDVNGRYLDVARAGTYDEWSLRAVPKPQRERWFEQETLAEVVRWRVKAELVRGMRFRQHNLLDGSLRPTVGGWDVVLLRNCLIYMRPQAAQRILSAIASALAPEGVIILGPGESFPEAQELELVTMYGCPVYAQRGARISAPAKKAGESDWTITRSDPVGPIGVALILPQGRTSDSPPSAPDAIRAHAAAALARGDLERAQAVLVRIADGDALAALSLANLRTPADPAGALALYARAVELDPLLAEARLLLGLAHRSSGDPALAVTELERALFLDPNLWPASFALASLYEAAGRQTPALREYRRTLKVLEASSQAPALRSLGANLEDVAAHASDVVLACRRKLA